MKIMIGTNAKKLLSPEEIEDFSRSDSEHCMFLIDLVDLKTDDWNYLVEYKNGLSLLAISERLNFDSSFTFMQSNIPFESMNLIKKSPYYQEFVTIYQDKDNNFFSDIDLKASFFRDKKNISELTEFAVNQKFCFYHIETFNMFPQINYLDKIETHNIFNQHLSMLKSEKENPFIVIISSADDWSVEKNFKTLTQAISFYEDVVKYGYDVFMNQPTFKASL